MEIRISEERFVWVVTIFTKFVIENWVSFIFNENLDRKILDGWILKISRIHFSQSSQDIYLPIVVCNSILIFHRKLERKLVAWRWTKKKIVVSTCATIFNSTKLNNRPTTPFSKISLAGLVSYTSFKKTMSLSLSLPNRESLLPSSFPLSPRRTRRVSLFRGN